MFRTSQSALIVASRFDELVLPLGQALFSNGWAFLIPYVLLYVVFDQLALRVSTLSSVFLFLHILNIVLASAYLYHSLRTKKPKISTTLFWISIMLLFFLPGAYLEFPSDPWEHFRRIFEWNAHQFVNEGSVSNKFTYFWGWTVMSHIPLRYRRFALDVYSAFWQFLLAYQFYRLFKRLGFSRSYAKIQVLAAIFLFGTNLFSFFRYYALSSTPLAYIAYLQSVILIMDLLSPECIKCVKKRDISFLFTRFLLLLALVVIIYYNHIQELVLLSISAIALVFYHFYQRNQTKRQILYLFGLVTVISLIFGTFIVKYPGVVPTTQWKPDFPYISKLGTFRIWDVKSAYFETIGIHGLISLLFALVLFKTKYQRMALLTLFPYYMMLFPPFVLLFSISHGQYTNYITYRALFAFPSSIMLVLGLKVTIDYLTKRLLPNATETLKVAALGCLVVLIALPPMFPYRGRLWFQLYKPPDQLTLRPMEVAAQWLASSHMVDPQCLLAGDTATAFMLTTHFALPGTRDSKTVTTLEDLEDIMQARHICGLLVAADPEARNIPDSLVAQLSGHWSPSRVRNDLLLNDDLESLTRLLIEKGWSKSSVPPFYWLYRPSIHPMGDA